MSTPDRVSIPVAEIERYAAAGWSPVCPDFEQPGFYFMRWSGIGEPREPAAK
jgi:hypothetical protein